MEIEYFDIGGRGTQLRMIAWYCNVPHKNKRVKNAEFAQEKKSGKLTFGSLPVINMPNG